MNILMNNLDDSTLRDIVDNSGDIREVRAASRVLQSRSVTISRLENNLRYVTDDLQQKEVANIIPRQLLRDVSVTERYAERVFTSRMDNRIRRFEEMIHTVTLPTAITLHDDNIDAVINTIEDVVHNRPQNARPYMLSLYHGSEHKAFGQAYNIMDNVLGDILERYEDAFMFDCMMIRYTLSGSSNIDNMDMYAESGEGIPEYLGYGYWKMDYMCTKKYCLVAAVVAWQQYYIGSMNPNMGFYKTAKQDVVKRLDLNKHIHTLKQLCNRLNIPYKVYYNLTSLENADPSETIKYMCVHVSCNHAALIVHESYMSKDMINWLIYRSKCTFVCLIKSRAPRIKQHSKDVENVEHANVKTPIVNVAMDIESYRNRDTVPEVIHEPMLCGYIDKSGYKYATGNECIDSCIIALTNTYDSVVVWSHYAGGYDNHFILERLLKYLNPAINVPVGITDSNGSIINMSVEFGSKKMQFKDSYRFFPMPLSRIGIILGMGAKEEFDVINATPDIMCSNRGLSYNKKDCEIVYKMLHVLRDEIMSKGWDDPLEFATLSSYVKHVFLSRYYDEEKTPLYVVPKWLHYKLNAGFKGGMNLLYYRGVIRNTIRCYDANAMYPSVGRNMLPYGKPVHVVEGGQILTVEFLERHFGFHVVTIVSSPNTCRPLHGITVNNKYMFAYFYNTPNQMIFSEELKYGLSLGYVYTIQESVTYSRASLLKQLFTDAYNYRVSSQDSASQQSWKLISNSGYGFFGFNKYERDSLALYGSNYEETLIHRHYMGQSIHDEISPGIFIAAEKRNVLLKDVCISVASAITSYARIYLHQIQRDVEKYAPVIYMDTDSIYTSLDIDTIPELRDKYRVSEDGSSLGKLKDEYADDPIVESVFLTNKAYGLKHTSGKYTIKLKGQDVSRTVLENGAILLHRDKGVVYESMKQCLSTGEPLVLDTSTIIKSRGAKVSGGKFIYEKVHKSAASMFYHKGYVVSDGSILPYVFNNGKIVPYV